MLAALLCASAPPCWGLTPKGRAAPSPTPSPAPVTDRVTRFSGPSLHDEPRTDVWSLLRDVPGLVLDRVAVGGSETAQQSLVIAAGDPGSGTTWRIDGADVTDPAALGFTAVYPDLGAAAEMSVSLLAGDVRVRTAGAQVALTIRDAPASWQGTVRGRTTTLAADNLPPLLQERPFFRNRTRRAWDGGATAGGPMLGDRLSVFLAAATARLRQETFTEHEEELATRTFTARASGTVAGVAMSLLALQSEKTHDDRDASLLAAPEARWRQSGPARLVSWKATRPVRGLVTRARASHLWSGFDLTPQGGTGSAPFEDFRGVTQRSTLFLETRRPRLEVALEVEGGRRAVGFEHRLLGGVGYRRSVVSTDAGYGGNGVLGFERQTVFFRTFDLTGFAVPTRAQSARSVHDHAELFLSDSARRGRLTATAGARVDRQAGRSLPSSVPANPAFPDLLPAMTYGGGETAIRWLDLLPRASLEWDLAGTGAAVVGIGYSAYGATLGSGDVVFDNPVGREIASLTYYWRDLDGDRVVDRGELDTTRGLLGAGGIDASAPTSTLSPHNVADGFRSPRTHALSLAGRAAIGPVRTSIHASWRRVTGVAWRPLRNLTIGDYTIRGAVTGDVFGEPYSVGYYAPASTSRIVPGNGRMLDNRDGYHQDVVEATVSASAAARRLRWSVWATLSDWRERFTDRTLAVQDPTSTDGEPLLDAGRVAVRGSGIGRGDVFVSARFAGGASARGTLPLRLQGALLLHARDGFPIPYYELANTGDPTAGTKAVLASPCLDRFRLPTLVMLDGRLARAFQSRGVTVTPVVEVFNLLNASTALQVGRDVELSSLGRPREILRPRILRAGIDLAFGGR